MYHLSLFIGRAVPPTGIHTSVARVATLGVLLVLLISRSSRAADEPAPLAVSMTGSTIRVSGIEPGGTVVINAALLEPQRQVYARMDRVETSQTDDDRDGAIVYDLQRPIPVRSIWAVAETATGRYAIATPSAYPRRELPFPHGMIKNTPVEDFDELTHSFFVAQILWIRRGVGAWVGACADGGAGDADNVNNGTTTTTVGYLRPLGGSAPVPKKIKKDDVLVLIDPFEMTFTSTRVSK